MLRVSGNDRFFRQLFRPRLPAQPAAEPQPVCLCCIHFRNDPAFLEQAIPGLHTLSSAHASVRANDGLCLKHDRYLSAQWGCADHCKRLPAV